MKANGKRNEQPGFFVLISRAGKNMRILSINSGSSSLKYALHDMERSGRGAAVESGGLMRIGMAASRFLCRNHGAQSSWQLALPDHAAAMEALVRHLRRGDLMSTVDCIGHRIVHGGLLYRQPEIVSPGMIDNLRGLVRLAPEHLPDEITAVEFFGREFPHLTQVACFDTSFHSNLPRLARIFPLPAGLEDGGLVRYGFHGLSYEYIMSRLKELEEAQGRIVIAHLGNGASMAAVRDGRSVDTTMGFTPAGGLMMSTRSGDLDPGVIFFLLREKNLDAESVARLINEQSGLAGVSGRSGDMEELLSQEKESAAAVDAVNLFCYLARKFLGALAFALGGLDTVVFTGGIGEKSPAVRARICAGLEFAGLKLEEERNRDNAGLISAAGSAVSVRVMKAGEELMIARHAARLMREKE